MPHEDILCVRRTVVEDRLGGVPLGFTTDPEVFTRLGEAVREAGEFRPRAELEEDPRFLQVIVEGLVTRGPEILALFRAVRAPRVGEFVETRHNAKVALFAGGHVEVVENGDDDLLLAALQRELAEELVFEKPPDPSAIRPLGIVCNASPDEALFHRVHIGLVYRVPVVDAVWLPEESDEFTHCEFIAGERLRELQPRMEGWGQLLADAVLAGQLSSVLSVPSVRSVR